MMAVVDDTGFERWYRSEHPRLVSAFTVATGDVDVAQDLVAEAFARALARWDAVAAMESPTGWVHVVATNLLRRRMRRAELERRLLARRSAGPATDSPSPALAPEAWAALAALPPRQRAVVALRIVLDLSQDDTARLLGVRPGTVSAALVAARRSLAAVLAEEAEHA
jgi:RNA polymerase sigma-70 factor (ECF subfamily)